MKKLQITHTYNYYYDEDRIMEDFADEFEEFKRYAAIDILDEDQTREEFVRESVSELLGRVGNDVDHLGEGYVKLDSEESEWDWGARWAGGTF